MSSLPTANENIGVRSAAAQGERLRSDTLAASILFLLGLTVAQKVIGLLRNILFCGLLEDSELGRWSLALSFLMLAAPLAVLGLPGTFGRYVEHYRQRGQLRAFLRRITLVSTMLAATAVVLVAVMSPWFAWIVFRDVQQTRLVQMLAFALAAFIVSNFLGELFASLRQVRVVSWMQLSNSVVFAIVGVGLLGFTRLREEAVLFAFIAGSVTASLVAACVMRSTWRLLPATSEPLAQRDLWFKLLPLAGWLWTTNLLTNLFDAADRFMIAHFAGVGTEAADALVGQYYCSRVVPLLLVGFASMLGGVVMPHLSHDWEASRRQAVSRRLNLLLKFVALAFTAAGVLILLTSPLLFGWILRGKYNNGLSVMPWTLVYCIWFGMAMIGQMYLWCAEKAKFGSLALLIGLLTNIALNLVLLPKFGLLGAVLATASGNAVVLVLILLLNGRLGMQVDRGTWLAAGLPLLLPLDASISAIAMIVIGWAAWYGNWLFSDQEKAKFADLLAGYWERTKYMFRRSKPVST